MQDVAQKENRESIDIRQQVPDWKIREPITRCKAFWRKAVAFRTISKIVRVESQDDFCRRICDTHRIAAERNSTKARTVGIWSMEKLGFALATSELKNWTLADERIPQHAQPIAHSGMGIGTVYQHGLRPAELIREINEHAHPDFQTYAFESLGTAWSLLSNRWFKRYFQLMSGTDFFRDELPDPQTFLDQFPTPVQRAIAHGYGRGLYFKALSLQSAFRQARKLSYLHAANIARGITFAYIVVNYADFPRTLEISAPQDLDPVFMSEIRRGGTSAMLLWEWTYPGFLDACIAGSEFQQQRIAEAKSLADPTSLDLQFMLD